MDRRIKKSQAAIMDALICLMDEKDFEKISMYEIAERADVNRGTIYSHYVDKYDLLDKCIEAQLEQLITSCLPEDEAVTYPSRDSLLRTLEQMERNAPSYRTLLTNKGIPSFRNHLQEMMKKGIRNQIIKNNLKQDDMSNDILVQFLSSAIVGVIEWWFMYAMSCSAKEITEKLWQLLKVNQVIPQFEY
ncbi:TetR/AcrR family transcriptional regulator [Alicyclobacillus fastidiosus]|uniref:TetR/AcrR family transcriptional regulator n=1 Tax=Alicyclobacillus fastidiosus TaxID=392011 RepID=A0ABY6ZEV2_9BACL|nr:TetR/AcrR family transcriptional regulator [Alicyclobacillus fastidiosus]WAH41430.1 TetR/AcrR family transcriptional regulator [Alicyclobacillus fastidiosus]GMA63055.1 TetR family transcriptional regulator [Alicyclobacillus fastidiosus]